jgi:hypothetical protein
MIGTYTERGQKSYQNNTKMPPKVIPGQQQLSFGSSQVSIGSPRNTPRSVRRVNYHLLHNGPPENQADSEADSQANSQSTRRPAKKRRNNPPVPAFNSSAAGPSNRVAGDTDPSSSSSEEDAAPSSPSANRPPPIRSIHHIETTRVSTKKRKERDQSSWTLHYFDVSELQDTWINKDKNNREQRNRKLTCKHCSWHTTDKKSGGKTSKLNSHMHDTHRFYRDDHLQGKVVTHGVVRSHQRNLDAHTAVLPPPVGPEEAQLQFMVLTNQPFSLAGHPAFHNIYTSVGASVPIANKDSAHNKVAKRFEDWRKELKEELKDEQSFSISFDGWGASNHTHILGVIAHWISKDWERKSVTIEFTEMKGKSGWSMAQILLQSFGPDFENVTVTEEGGVQKTTTEKFIGLDIAHKLFAVTGDGAKPNNTMCDHLLTGLEDRFESWTSNSPKFKFRGRDSRIYCIAHIIALVCGSVLQVLKAGTYQEADELFAAALDAGSNGNPVFSNDCNSLSIFRKVRTIVLFMMSSDERVAAWRSVCKILIPLDVKTRWNSLYLMMSAARLHRESFAKYVRKYPALKPLLPTDDEWKVCEILERCLKPFFDYTLSVSSAKPCLNDVVSIIWGLDDTLDDIRKADGEYGDVGPELRAAFDAGMDKLEEYHDIIRSNCLYYLAQALDPRVKFNNIRACCDDAPEMEEKIKAFLRKEYPVVAAAQGDAANPNAEVVSPALFAFLYLCSTTNTRTDSLPSRYDSRSMETTAKRASSNSQYHRRRY